MQRVLRPVGRQADTTVQALTRLPGPSHTGSRHPPRAVRRRGAATSARREARAVSPHGAAASVRSSESLLLAGLGPNVLERHDGDWLQDDGVVLEVNLEKRLAAQTQSAPRIR